VHVAVLEACARRAAQLLQVPEEAASQQWLVSLLWGVSAAHRATGGLRTPQRASAPEGLPQVWPVVAWDLQVETFQGQPHAGVAVVARHESSRCRSCHRSLRSAVRVALQAQGLIPRPRPPRPQVPPGGGAAPAEQMRTEAPCQLRPGPLGALSLGRAWNHFRT